MLRQIYFGNIADSGSSRGKLDMGGIINIVFAGFFTAAIAFFTYLIGEFAGYDWGSHAIYGTIIITVLKTILEILKNNQK